MEEKKIEINIQAIQGICSEFKDGSKRKKQISVVIAPLKVTSNEEQNKVSVVTGCNMWKSCNNEGCYYSMAARVKSKS